MLGLFLVLARLIFLMNNITFHPIEDLESRFRSAWKMRPNSLTEIGGVSAI